MSSVPATDTAASVWLIEGAPGAGKTEAARLLCEAACAEGRTAQWWREEARAHPITPATLRKRSGEPSFVPLCAQSFRQCLEIEKGVLIFEGTAFQSILRFLFARGAGDAEMIDALGALSAALTAAETRLLLLTTDDPARHYAEFVRSRRGEDWTAKVVAYVERTPLAQRRGWCGFEGFVRFWSEYQDLCLWAAERLGTPVLVTPSCADRGAGLPEEALRFFGLGGPPV